ncbi:hypothetical protein F7725_028565 [Dissostichus mawsoni]|uniref:PKD domain-containing protein n=1 Tax=Dissostichus mawsoni TaxID=36200 RepID=A0A7J5XH97_DISMA|nr:hypothetical protein F7725_028565 [Dissostichus mawsoni]
MAVSEAADPAQLLWIFGDSTSERTASRSVTKRYRTPGRYRSSISNTVQSAVRLNRLLHPASVLQNQALRLRCRFRVEVTVFNLVSSASLSAHIFVVDRPCLHYTWSLLDSAGRVFSLPLVDKQRQKLKLPSLLLNYDTYTAIARCLGEKLNWDQSFSISAVCEGCDTSTKNIQYTWSLFLVNASSKPAIEEPSPISSLNMRTSGSGEEPFYHPLGELDPPKPLYSSTEYPPLDNSGVLYSDHFTQSGVITELPVDPDSSADWEFPFPFLESEDVGDRPGVDGESFGPGDDSEFEPASHERKEPILLDLPRHPIDRGLFESYTYTGVSPLLSLRPFSLTPGADTCWRSLPLFFKTNPAPKGVICQVQPIRGVELYTHFSIFCTSGKQDLLYDYSISVGDGPRRTLYAGRDFQYYFSLPSVQPSFFRDASSLLLFLLSSSSSLTLTLTWSWSGLRNLSALVHHGNSLEVTFASARRVTAHVQDVSQQFSESGGPASYRLEQKTLHSLLSLLSFSLQTSTSADITQTLDPDPRDEASRGGGGSISTKQKFILMHKVQEHRVSTGLIALYSSYQNQSSTVISSGSSSFSLPPSLIQLVHGSRPRSEREYVLLRSRVNHHSFNITQKHLQQAIQLSVVFTPPNRPFPIMLLFR